MKITATFTEEFEDLKTIFNERFEQLRLDINQQVDFNKVFTPKSAAEYLGITTRTLHTYKKKGLIDFVMVDGLIRYRKSAIDDFLDRHTVRSRSP